MESYKDVLLCTCNDIRNKKNISSRSYILQIMLWHQSLKSIHYRTLLIFQNKKKLEGQNMGGDKRHVIPPPPPPPPHVKTWGG